MYTIDQVNDMLDEIADGIPEEIYQGLNGGIVLREEVKLHPQGQGDLYIMGEYSVQPSGMGRQIFIYYGSFMKVYGNAPEDVLRKQLRHTLYHEFTHHLESQAGEYDLEVWDKMRMLEYHRTHHRDVDAK